MTFSNVLECQVSLGLCSVFFNGSTLMWELYLLSLIFLPVFLGVALSLYLLVYWSANEDSMVGDLTRYGGLGKLEAMSFLPHTEQRACRLMV